MTERKGLGNRNNQVDFTAEKDYADKRTRVESGLYASSGKPVERDTSYIEFTKEMDYADKRTGIVA